MFAKRSRASLVLSAGFMLLSACGWAAAAELPPALKALQDQGLTVMEEFKVGGGLRAYAAVAGDRPVAVYVTSDGNAIVGTRLDARGQPMDEADLDRLAAKPIGDKAWAQLEAAGWVRDGKADAPRIVYTFTDANCPYCHRFWEQARPWVDAGKVQIRHVMVGIIRADSPGKAAAILGAADPSAALLENEHTYDKGGITPVENISDALLKTLADNQMLMVGLGFQGTPGIVVRDGGGLLRKYNGLPRPEAMDEVMGPR